MAKAINERGLIVGDLASCGRTGACFGSARFLTPDAVATDAIAVAVNDRGQVVGNIEPTFGGSGGASVSLAEREDDAAPHAARLV